MDTIYARMGIKILVFTLLLHFSINTDNPLFELSELMLKIYKDPKSGKSEELVKASKDYLYELVKLQMGTRINKTGSLDTLRKLYLEGNPPFHVRNIPWDRLIEVYQWKDTNLNEYQQTISDTRRIWRECLDELDKRKESDEII